MAATLPTRSDCSRCAALCCIAYPSQDMPGFAASKDAGQPCPKLDRCGRCTIYSSRAEQGFAGCIAFECFGAGQHVVQQLFGGRDWRDDPALLEPMVESFLAMRPVSDLMFLAERAAAFDPAPDERAQLAQLTADLEAIAASRESLRDTAGVARAERTLKRIYATIDRNRVRMS